MFVVKGGGEIIMPDPWVAFHASIAPVATSTLAGEVTINWEPEVIHVGDSSCVLPNPGCGWNNIKEIRITNRVNFIGY